MILGILVFVHELGHFLMARRAGMEVEEFGFGIPPRIKGWKKFGTLVSVNWIPIGGFVRVKGGETTVVTEKELNDKNNYHSKTLMERFLFVIMGVVFNFILAVVLLTFGYMMGMTPLPGTSLYTDSLKDQYLQIEKVVPNSNADKAGIQGGDIIVNIDNNKILDPQTFSNYVKENKDRALAVTVLQENIENTYYVQPDDKGLLGLYLGLVYKSDEVRLNPVSAFYYAFLNSCYISWQTFIGIFKTFSGLIMHFTVPSEVSGPIGIVSITHQVVQVGFMSVIKFMAILSLSLAVLNIIPFPALDGGRLAFLVAEGVLRRRINAKIETYTHIIGFMLLIVLLVLVTYQDILNLILK